MEIPAESPTMAYLALRASLNRYGKAPHSLEEADRADVDRQALREFLIQSKVLGTDEAGNVVVPDAVVEKLFLEIRARYESEEEFLDDLAANGLTSEGLRRAIGRDLRVETVLDRVSARAAAISDLDVKLYYYMHPDKFQVPETRTARHVLVTINPKYPENTREAALARILDIRKRVAKKPRRFGEQAEKHSECPTAMQGGRLGRLPRGKLYGELERVLFSLAGGAVSEVVESPLGFHVLYCEQIHPPGTLEFGIVEGKIRELLEGRRRRICAKAWLKNVLRKSADE